jgi:hypothetical protein
MFLYSFNKHKSDSNLQSKTKYIVNKLTNYNIHYFKVHFPTMIYPGLIGYLSVQWVYVWNVTNFTVELKAVLSYVFAAFK